MIKDIGSREVAWVSISPSLSRWSLVMRAAMLHQVCDDGRE